MTGASHALHHLFQGVLEIVQADRDVIASVRTRMHVEQDLVAADFALFKARLERLQRVGPRDPVAWQDIRAELIDLRERLGRPKH